MKANVVAPTVGESITEVSILKWHKQDGEAVKTGEILLEIESDKATVEVIAESDGVLKIVKPEGETVPIGEVLAEIDSDGQATASAPAPAPAVEKMESSAEKSGILKAVPPSPDKPEMTPPSSPPPPIPAGAPGAPAAAAHLSPAVQKMVTEKNIDPSTVTGTGKDGRITKGDLLSISGGGATAAAVPTPAPAPASAPKPAPTPSAPKAAGPGERRVKMSRLRTKIAERLVQAQQTAAILTTFNEVDMSPVMKVRKEYKEKFKAKHGVNLSFMSFFTRACCEALKKIPEVNAYIEEPEIVYHDYQDISIAVGTDRGLVVPVLRNAGEMTFLDIEKGIGALALKAREGKLSIPDMTGGTFTISNGGTYGSLLSTPILNPPQSAILGMHAIKERPIADESGGIVIRPMMNLALSYDHRIIDGKEAVTFLIIIKDLLEKPEDLNLDFVQTL